MQVNERVQAAAREALDLVRAGKPDEATAAIQRTLRSRLARQGAPNTTESRTDIPAQVRLPSPRSVVHCPALMSDRWRRLSACPSGAVATRTVPAHGLEPGAQFISGCYTNQAGTRSYKLYIPSAYSGQALPLVVMLHGCQQTPDDFAAGTGMNAVAESYPCLVVYPAQEHTANRSNCWNWFRPTDQQRDRGEPSLIAGITRQVMSSHCIKTKQVFAAGLSAGGAMAVTMGATYPDLYAAIGVHSGLPYRAAHDLPSAFAAMSRGPRAEHQRLPDNFDGAGRTASVPAIVFHGDQDTKVHPLNGEQLIAQWTRVHGDKAPNLIVSVEHGRVADGHAYTRRVHRDASGRSVLELWRIHGAGHAWSGGSPSGSFTDPLGPAATQEMLRFFREHHLPG